MHDFVPEDISTIVVDPRKEVVSKHVFKIAQTFYEDIGNEPIYIRGAYFVGHSSTANKLIDFFVVNPKNKVIYSKRKSEEGIFRFNTTMPGRYSFIFSNIKDRKSVKDVTIAIHTPDNDEGEAIFDRAEEAMINDMKAQNDGSSEEQAILSKEVEDLRLKIREIYFEVRNVASEARIQALRQETVNVQVEDNNKSNFYSALIESGIFIIIGAAQVMYIKNLLDSKRVI